MKLILFALVCIALHLHFRLGYKWSDIFSPTRWKMVYIWLLKKHLRYVDGSETYLTKNELLQYAYRVARCSDCLQNQKCKNCNCDVEGKINVRSDSCEYINADDRINFGQFFTEEEFSKFLESNELVFDVKIVKKNGTV